MDEFIIRKMERADIATAVKWANEEGWQPGINAEAAFTLADENGLFAGILNGEMISCITAVSYNSKYGFIGMYIVKPGFRGKGYGIQTWNAGINYLADHVIGLDGVVAQQENYQQSGLRVAHRNERYQGIFRGRMRAEVSPLADIPFSEVLSYDRLMFPAERERLLSFWVSGEGVAAKAYVENGQLAGYGVLRPCRGAVRVGPLFANNYRIADVLLDAVTADVTDGTVIYLDVPKNNLDALRLAESRGMKPVFETLRMYRGAVPDIRKDNIFGISSFELG